MKPIFFFLAFLSFFPASAQELKYTVCENCWNADSLGNHRVVVNVPAKGKVATVRIPWRRRDMHPETRMILVTDKAGNLIRNVGRGSISRTSGSIFFEPTAGSGKYYVYHLKYLVKGRSNYPVIVYPEWKESASHDWLTRLKTTKAVQASVVEMQSIDALNSFYPMEVIATKAETNAVKAKGKGRGFLVFPEDRMNPVRLRNDLPQRWILRGPSTIFKASADRGENFSFQLGVYAHAGKLNNVKVRFSDFTGTSGAISKRLFSCLNTEGIGWDGASFQKQLDVEAGTIQPLWCLITVPEDQAAGDYEGIATILAGNSVRKVTVTLTVTNNIAQNGGVNEPWKQTRLTWLNSQMAANDEVIAPYTPLELQGNSISLLGRKLEIGDNGLPKQITSYFSPLMTKLDEVGHPILANGFDFQVAMKDKGLVKWIQTEKVKFNKLSDGAVTWTVTNASETVRLEVTGRLEFDGFISYTMQLTALVDTQLEDVRMRIPIQKSFTKYMLGLGQSGGLRPTDFSWSWDVANKNQDGAWIGDVHGGMQFSLRAENYSRPLNTNFYLQKPLNLPPSWGNAGKGGVRISDDASSASLIAFSGAREMKAGETLYYNFTLLITPFHTLDTDFQWKTRFYHKYSPIDTILRRGASVVNIHHANDINPYINYPFLRTQEMKVYIDNAHQKGLKVKIYNTVRELSNHAYETQPLRSLGTEIYSPGNGGGFSWLQEHLSDNYIAAWFVPELKDAAIINSGMSRWHNYYVEGMSWLVRYVGIDGIYLDDVAFDRTTMKRIRRVLKSERGPGIIDLHSANQFNKRDGFNNSANLYLEHFPYLDRLWFGEYFDYDSKPDFWLTEVSGIPFGLMGEMLEKGGNPWRGMVYGITNRMPWTENSDPRYLWRLWDNFGIQGSEMIGYWVDQNPVKTDNPEVLATIYKKKDAVLISVASWATEDVSVKLIIDWKTLGMKPALTAEVPEVKDFQNKQTITLGNKFLVPKGKGLLIIVR